MENTPTCFIVLKDMVLLPRSLNLKTRLQGYWAVLINTSSNEEAVLVAMSEIYPHLYQIKACLPHDYSVEKKIGVEGDPHNILGWVLGKKQHICLRFIHANPGNPTPRIRERRWWRKAGPFELLWVMIHLYMMFKQYLV